jgi:hypothetical protein
MSVGVDALEQQQLSGGKHQAHGPIRLERDIAPAVAAELGRHREALVAGGVVEAEVTGMVVGVVDGVSIGSPIGHAVVAVQDLHQHPQTLDGRQGVEVVAQIGRPVGLPHAQPDGDIRDVQLGIIPGLVGDPLPLPRRMPLTHPCRIAEHISGVWIDK